MPRLLVVPILLSVLALGACDSQESAFCRKVREVATGGQQVLPVSNTDEINFEQANAELRELRAKAPRHLKDDLDVFIEANAKLESGDTAGLSDRAFTDRFAAAVENYDTYATDTCKVPTEE